MSPNIATYCAECGQAQRQQGSTLRELLKEGFNKFTDLDGRAWRTFTTEESNALAMHILDSLQGALMIKRATGNNKHWHNTI